MKELKIKIYEINHYLDKKNGLLVFLLIFLGVLVPSLSGMSSTNFWQRWYSIVFSPFFNMMYFLSVWINVVYMLNEMSQSYYVISRSRNYIQAVKKYALNIVAVSFVIALVAIVLSIAGAISFCYGDTQMISHPYYSLDMLFYMLLYMVRFILFSCIINVIIYLVFLCTNKICRLFVILILDSLFVLLPNMSERISHFYNMPLIYHYYFMPVPYINVMVEITCSVLQAFILLLFIKILGKYITKRKRDLI